MVAVRNLLRRATPFDVLALDSPFLSDPSHSNRTSRWLNSGAVSAAMMADTSPI